MNNDWECTLSVQYTHTVDTISKKTCRQFNVGAVHDASTIAHSTTVAITIAHVPVLVWGWWSRTLEWPATGAVKGCAVVDPKVREPLSDRLAVRLRVVPLLIPKGRLQVMFEVDGHVWGWWATDGTNANAKLTTSQRKSWRKADYQIR